MAVKQCRIWWPKHLLSREPTSDLVLFGWFMHSHSSVDVVVAIAISPGEIPVAFNLQEILHYVNSKMPTPLQDSSRFCMLGLCSVPCNGDLRKRQSDPVLKNMQLNGMEENNATNAINFVNGNLKEKISLLAPVMEESRNWDCNCQMVNPCIEPSREESFRYGNCIQVVSKSQKIVYKESRWIPEFHHMHQDGHLLFNCNVHLIIYDLPVCGKHHFSVNSWGYSKQDTTSFKVPNWFSDLQRKPIDHNLESVVGALNCANAAIDSFNRHLHVVDRAVNLFTLSRWVSLLYYLLAVSVASISSVTYTILQLFHTFVRFGSHSFLLMKLGEVFTQTWTIVHIRSCQFLYWPIFLLGTGFREQSNVEYAHRSALRENFVWSNIAMDVIMGISFGTAVLVNVESVYSGISLFAHKITDNLLRTGCVWLMGVPAGFKLNTELAEILGAVSLDAIQIFSTLWFFMGSLFWNFLRGLAFGGIFFGLTFPAALCIDLLRLATLHIQIVHWLLSFLYSRQIQAVTSLWRLFRGRKWNPLRQRLDSYEYTVEQHVVGSLFFTPLLLLLPTTSVFYIFFTILNTTVSFICIIIEISVSVLLAVPYAEILLWIVRRRRFPSGIWFEIKSDLDGSGRKTSQRMSTAPETVVSLLQSNHATLSQVLAPSYRDLFQRLRSNVGGLSAYAVLSGQRTPSTLQINLPPSLPWMYISCREYWQLCLSAVLACR